MFCEAWPDLKFFIFTSGVPKLLYYSHMPTVLIALALGLFVFLKNKNSLASRVLFAISITFFIWITIDLILWVNPDSRVLMFLWSFLGILSSLIYLMCLYFVYVFIEKKDISFRIKTILGILFLPVVLFTPTHYNLGTFDIAACGAAGLEGKYFTSYYFAIGFITFVWILVFSFLKYRKAEKSLRKQILSLAIGIELFLLSFFSSGFLASYFVWTGATKDFATTQYGLFGMPIFMGFLVYLIVKYKAFNIKLLGAQALVAALVILIGSEFFFMPLDNVTNIVLISVTLLLSMVFGWFLIKSVKTEVQRKEELQLMSNKLAQANDKLRALDNAKSEFISIASHQLRTPLTAIKGFVSLLLEGAYDKLQPKQEEVMNKVYTSNERLINLVEDLLNVSRMESGRMEFKFVPTKMEDVCQEIIDTFVLRAKDKNLYLHYQKTETPLPELAIDAGKVKEVVSNIIDNALKYTLRGGVTLRLERGEFPISNFQFLNNDQNPNTKIKNETRDAVRVIVSDTGIGIPATELPYLFNKFSRGKDIARLNTGGTGLGLYVGKGMIENNGGRIWAESDGEGKGSRFIIELPIKQSEELLERWG